MPAETGRGWAELEDVLCSQRCMRLADGWLDGESMCVRCADLVVEREAALSENPWLVLPDLHDDPFFYTAA